MGFCVYCGKEFPDSNRGRKYCNDVCYRADKREKKRAERERLRALEKPKEEVAPCSANGEPMHKTTGKYCQKCIYYNRQVRCCDYYEETGCRRGCPIGWCDKFELEKTKRKSRVLRRREKHKMDSKQKMYNDYRKRFAKDRGITVEEATEYQAVKLYKHWLQEHYKVEIDEKV